MEVQSSRIGRSTIPYASASERDQSKTPSPVCQTNYTDTPTNDSVTVAAVETNQTDSLEKANKMDGETEEIPRSSSPPNPFDESDEEEEEGEKEEDTKTPAKKTTNGDLASTLVTHHEGASRPVPAPRRVSEPAPPPRPAPRVRLPRTGDGLTVGACSLQNITDNRWNLLIFMLTLSLKLQVKTRSLRFLPNLEKDHSLLEGS